MLTFPTMADEKSKLKWLRNFGRADLGDFGGTGCILVCEDFNLGKKLTINRHKRLTNCDP